MTHFIISSRGSRGDVNPLLGVGRELVRRGHRVTAIVNEFLREAAEATGAEFVRLSSREAYLEEAERNGAGDAVQLGERLERWMLADIREAALAIEQHATKDTVVVARSWLVSGRLMHDKLGIPSVTVYFTPDEMKHLAPREAGFLAVMQGQPWLAPIARTLYEKLVAPAIDQGYDPHIGPVMDELRKTHGLAPVRRILTQWIPSPDLELGLWPDAFYPPWPHWSEALVRTGFVVEDGTAAALDDELRAFLATGAPPVVILPGSYRSTGAETYLRVCMEACRALGRRGVLLTDFPQLLPAELPRGFITRRYVPLGALLPRAAAVVHHGGIGTIARALEAGIPQLVVPVFFDQPVNARRIRALGVGDFLTEADLSLANAQGALRRILSDPDVATRARSLARQRGLTDGAATAAAHLEAFASARGR